MRKLKKGMALGMLLLGFGMVAHRAQAEEGPCREDMKRLCGDKLGMAMMDCMRAREAEFSPACKEHRAKKMAEINKRQAEILQTCKADLDKFCANVTPGEGREMSCLMAYNDKISGPCKEKVPHMGMHRGMGKDMGKGMKHK